MAVFVDGHIGFAADAPSDITASGQNLDLADGKLLMQSLGFQNKYAYVSLFEGQIKELKFHMLDTKQKRQLALLIIPADFLYEPVDSARAIHFSDGVINYDNETLALNNVNIKGRAIQCIASAKVSHCTGQAQLDAIKIDNATIDSKEASGCFTAEKNPQPLRQTFIKLLDGDGIADIQGKVTGRLFAQNK